MAGIILELADTVHCHCRRNLILLSHSANRSSDRYHSNSVFQISLVGKGTLDDEDTSITCLRIDLDEVISMKEEPARMNVRAPPGAVVRSNDLNWVEINREAVEHVIDTCRRKK